MGIPETTIYTWRSQHKQYGAIAFVGSGHKCLDPQMAEIRAMEKKSKSSKPPMIFKKKLKFTKRLK